MINEVSNRKFQLDRQGGERNSQIMMDQAINRIASQIGSDQGGLSSPRSMQRM